MYQKFGSRTLVAIVLLLLSQITPISVSADTNETAVGGPNAAHESSITMGLYHSCALLSSGGVTCWGFNNDGELGDNTTDDKKVPTAVTGLSNGVTAIVASGFHTCALLTSGGVTCWGFNGNGQLGDNTLIKKLVPTAVNGLSSGVTAITAGNSHTCALFASGGVSCWGRNHKGQLGNNTTDDKLVPIAVRGLTGVTAITAGDAYTCALLATGTVKCWGENIGGQLGDNTTADKLVPTAVAELTDVTAITAGGYHTCALLTSGAVKCWGNNGNGQLGDNTTNNVKLVPTAVTGLSSGAVAVTVSTWHTCALLTSGAVKCWGGNDSGQLGDNTIISREVPTAVTGLSSGVTAITTGGNSTCALLTSSGIACWGNNAMGMLGNNTTTGKLIPTNVTGLPNSVGPTTTSSTSTTTTIVPSVPIISTKPVLTTKKQVTAKQIASYLKMKYSNKTSVTIQIRSSSRKVCTSSTGRIRAVRKGRCSTVVKGFNIAGKKITRNLVFTVTK